MSSPMKVSRDIPRYPGNPRRYNRMHVAAAPRHDMAELCYRQLFERCKRIVHAL